MVSDPQRRLRLVLADGEPASIEQLVALLDGAADIDVVGCAKDEQTLMEMVGTHEPDVVLVEVRGGGFDGVAALGHLPAGPPPYRAVLTTLDRDDYVEAALAAGAHGYLLKDAAPEELIGAVRHLASGGAMIDPRIAARLLPRLRTPPAPDPLGELSVREREVLVLLGDGASNATIGRILEISESTVKGHVSRLLIKLGVENRVQAALIGKRLARRLI